MSELDRQIKYACLVERFNPAEEYIEAIRELASRGDFTLGPKVIECEEKFAEMVGSQFAVGVSSGTEGLRLSLLAMGVRSGDEVITTPTSFIATSNVIRHVGAKPVFVDIDDQFVIDPTKIEESLTRNTKAIIPVHWGGNMADMPAIMDIARRHDLLVLEDAAPAVGSSMDGKNAGTFGDLAEFSFHPYKNFCAWGDGGMVVTDDPGYAAKLRLLRNHGLEDRDNAVIPGYNSRLAPIQAVIATIQIGKISEINNRRIKNSLRLDEMLSDVPEVRVPVRRANVQHIFNNYMVTVEDRDQLISFLKEKGIEALVHYPIPMHLQTVNQDLGFGKGDFPVAEYQADHVVTLPNHEYLNDDDIDYIGQAVSNFYK